MTQLRTDAHAGPTCTYLNCAPVTGSADASADPRIGIDPSYLAAHPGASIDIRAGVGNTGPVAAVPEPSERAMLLAGFALLGQYRAGSQRRNTAATALTNDR